MHVYIYIYISYVDIHITDKEYYAFFTNQNNIKHNYKHILVKQYFFK